MRLVSERELDVVSKDFQADLKKKRICFLHARIKLLEI